MRIKLSVLNLLKSATVLLTFFILPGTFVANAQYFPTFGASYGSYVPGTSGTPQGVAVATGPASTAASQLIAAFNMGYLGIATSTDGINWSSGTNIYSSLHCDAVAHFTHCSPAITVFNGTPYVSFWNASNNLEVWIGQLVGGGNNAFTWTQVYNQDPGYGGMASSPQMVVYQNKLFIIYAVNSLVAYNGQTIRNAMQETVFDGASWSTTNTGLGYQTFATPSQVGLSELNGTLYMVSQQNNSTRHLFYWSSSDGYNWTGTEFSGLSTDSGLSMVTFNNNLVTTAKQNNNQDHIFLFSSPNGFNWYGQQQTPLMHPQTTAAVTLWNGGIQMLYIDHSGSGLFNSTFAPY